MRLYTTEIKINESILCMTTVITRTDIKFQMTSSLKYMVGKTLQQVHWLLKTTDELDIVLTKLLDVFWNVQKLDRLALYIIH